MRKLTPNEITLVVKKIRTKYDEYSFKYFKSKKHKANFEDRYVGAIKNGTDISNFLLAEISAVEELLKVEEEKVLNKKISMSNEPKMDFADKVMEQNKKKIEKYPDLDLHQDANPEIRRLFGALNTLEQQYWPNLYLILKNTMYSLSTKTMINLEHQLHQLGGSGREGIAVRLERYVARLNRFPRDYPMIDKEEKDYILESAFILHGLHEVLLSVIDKHHDFDEKKSGDLREIIDYIDNVITDFRLKDLKKR